MANAYWLKIQYPKGGLMTEIILAISVSIISIGVMVWVAIMSNKFFKYFKEIAQEIIDEQKKNQ